MADMERAETMFKSIDGKLDDIFGELKKVKEENELLKNKVKDQETRIQFMEKEMRKKNLIIKGVADTHKEGTKDTEEKINKIMEKMGLDVRSSKDIDVTMRIGKYREDKARPILVKLTRECTKINILKKSATLKGSDIWIDEDYPKDIQIERNKLLPILKEARSSGQNAYLKYDKLIINNELYTKADDRKSETINEGRRIYEHNKQRNTNTSAKRTVAERSPQGDSLQQQLNKIHRTQLAKNE